VPLLLLLQRGLLLLLQIPLRYCEVLLLLLLQSAVFVATTNCHYCCYCKVPLLSLLQSAVIVVTAKAFIVFTAKCLYCCYCKVSLLLLLQSYVIDVTAKCFYCCYCKVPLLLLMKVPQLLLKKSASFVVNAKYRFFY